MRSGKTATLQHHHFPFHYDSLLSSLVFRIALICVYMLFIKVGDLTDCAFSDRLAVNPAGRTPVHFRHTSHNQFDARLDYQFLKDIQLYPLDFGRTHLEVVPR